MIDDMTLHLYSEEISVTTPLLPDEIDCDGGPILFPTHQWDRVDQNRSDQSRANEFCIPRAINIVDGNRNDETHEGQPSDRNLIKQPSPNSLAKYFYET